MLNPMSRAYQGYSQANQSLLEEDEDGLDPSGAGRTTRGDNLLASTSGGRRVSWGESSRMNVLRPNTHNDDRITEQDSSDDEVPQSFMVEAATPRRTLPSLATNKGKVSDRSARRATSKHPILPITNFNDEHAGLSMPPRPSDFESPLTPETNQEHERKPMRGLDEYERALWNWVNVYNLDAFLQDVYAYYEGKGIYCMALSRGLNLLTVGFVIFFSTFLLGCVDYSRIRPEGHTRLSDVVVDHCISKFSGFTLLFFTFFGAFYVWQIVSFVLGIMRLVDMYRFFTYLLGIPDADIQTISWPEIVRRIGAIREQNPNTALSSANQGHTSSSVTAKLDAHDIANRIMRQENYLIALFNKELLDLHVPLPAALSAFLEWDGVKGSTLTRALEWNLRFCLMDYLFDSSGRVRKVFLKEKNRSVLVEGLQRRFIFMGILNAIFAPLVVLYLIMYSFFRYFEEYHKNPSTIGGRSYTPFAQWKFREFNELPHHFTRRLDESYPYANMYIGQFPNEKLALIMRFVSFVAGSFAAVLLLASVIDPDIFLNFEITPHRTVLFYVGIFGSILAVARGMIPDENRVFDPELLMSDVVQFTHYMPSEWKNQLHSQQVHKEFGKLFALKVIIFAQELLSVVLTPFILWFSLPKCGPAIVEFFREFTVHVDGLGYVCSFAVFDFKRHGNVHFGAPTDVRDERLTSKEGKMEKSFLNFKAAHPEWNPADPSGSLYLSRMADFSAALPPHIPQARRNRFQDPSLQGTGMGTVVAERRLSDRAQEYDRALRRSQKAASSRPRNPSSGAIGESTANAQSARPVGYTSPPRVSSPLERTPTASQAIHSDDIGADGGFGSELGESYVDGHTRAGTQPHASQQEDEEVLDDGGMLGLLAQIYGTKGARPATRVI
ncbi:APG9-domain-containing protein [Rickenella mellea]|uniref:Autophagy-related protein 9 n=1 Tax=Rickenella mellea TaxID=50990 RepID=A0A4Y7QBF7_9AGAM|nr:APG9-domain-containing protein [Rickenella mellea]